MATAQEVNQAELGASITRAVVALEEFQTALHGNVDPLPPAMDALRGIHEFTAAYGRWLTEEVTL